MKTLVSFFRDLHEDKSGAAFIEYTALLGVILAVGIGLLATVGEWAQSSWTYLCTTLKSNVPTGATAVAGSC